MLTILNELSKVRDEQTGTFDFDALKIVYIALMKALVQEMISNFSNRSSPFGIKVGELTWYDQSSSMKSTFSKMSEDLFRRVS